MDIPKSIISTILLILIFFSAFFSASETAHIALSKIRLKNLLKKGIKKAKVVQRIILNLDTFIPTILVGNNLVNIAISAIVTALFVAKFGPNWGVIISTFTTAFFLLVICEITPKILSTQHPDKVALLTAPLMEKLIRLFKPFALFFSGISKFLIKLFGGSVKKRSPLITEEELRLMIEVGKDEGVVSDQERRMLQRIFVFGDTKVSEVMVPKEEIVAIDIKS
jgi:putative hemolysin